MKGVIPLGKRGCILFIRIQQSSRVLYLVQKCQTHSSRDEISNNVVCATSKGTDQPEHMRSPIRAFCCRLNILCVKLLTEHHLEFLSLRGTDLSESTLVKMPHCWKSHVTAHLYETQEALHCLLEQDTLASA